MEKLNKVKLQFFTNISHELRTPLTLIIGPIQTMLAEIDVKNKFHQQLQIVNQNSQRLLRLVNQLLDFRKVETENARPRVSEGNIVQFMNDVKKSFDPLADKMNILFTIQSSLTTQQLWFDADMCEKIFFNLLSNAFKHTPENGEISIVLEDCNDGISISIRDNGTGIKKKYLDNLFQTFFSFDEDRTHASSGIGLALVKGLVNLHHGTVDVESEENVFTKFIVTFRKGFDHFTAEERVPREDQVAPDALELPISDSCKEEQKYEPSSDDAKKNKILVIEDNLDVSDYIRTIFVRDFVVLQAANGKEGLAKAREFVPDIIISDIMMPEMDGISFCRTLKADIKTSHIPIILLTARGSMDLRMEGLESGADEYVTKPFTPKVLELNVKNLIRTRKALQTFYQAHGTLSLEPKRISLNSPDEQFLKTALLSVENNISDPEYTVEMMCRDVGMSYTQLYRKIKALTGQTVNEFIKNIRLKRAAQLLEQNQLTVAEITYKVGFTDLQHFRECFKKLFGVTPSHYPQQDIKNAS
jgi:DNA-binding response OmpR family regulator/anti-sigma regulatory factor (Ser/Thr protein kinase)